jgi:hypothetical protein
VNGAQTWGLTNTACPLTEGQHWYHVQMHFIRLSASQYEVHHLRVRDVTVDPDETGTPLEDDLDLGTFGSVGGDTSHGNGIDVQLDIKSGSFEAYYDRVRVVRW